MENAKLKLLVAMGAAISSMTYAQTTVALYGVVDANIEYVSHIATAAGGSGDRIGLTSGGLSGSRWGLRGEENLGGGLSAIFALESGFGVDDGKSQQGGRLFGRQAFVGLQSKSYGSVTLGRQYSVMFDVLGNFTPLSYSTQYEPYSFMEGAQLRSDNAIKYTGVFGPLTATAHWSFGNGVAGSGENPGQFRRDTGYGAALVYSSGPFGAVVVYDQTNPSLTGTGGAFIGTGSNKRAAVGGSYAIGPATFKAGYRWQRNTGVNGQEIFRDDMYWLGMHYQVTAPLLFKIGYYYADTKNNNGINPTNPWQVSFVADYSFSKRTDVYLTAAISKNAGLNFDGSYALAPGKNTMLGGALGIRHKF